MYRCFIILLGAFILACGQKKNNVTGWNFDNLQETAYYPMKIPDKIDIEKETPIKIILQRDKKRHELNFGLFDKETTWKIYDWLAYHGSDSQLPKPLIEKSFKANVPCSIDITSLKTGQFMISFTALVEICNFEFTIE